MKPAIVLIKELVRPSLDPGFRDFNTCREGVVHHFSRFYILEFRADKCGFHFMHTENYEQTFLNGDVVTTPELLKDGQAVEILVHAETGEVLACDLPQFVELEITYTEPGVKGDTATNTFKPATMETGAIIKVPLFIGEGEKIRIDTKTGEYVERVNN